jgi:hypothetical protein
MREWAKAQGIEVKDRGRVPPELVVKFKSDDWPVGCTAAARQRNGILLSSRIEGVARADVYA